MTYRRWQRAIAEGEPDPDELTRQIGPLEVQVRAELETLGWTPLCGPGPLATTAARCVLMAETYDRTQNAQALPALDRAIGEALREARQVAGFDMRRDPAPPDDDKQEEGVDDFTKRRRERGSDPPPVGGAATR